MYHQLDPQIQSECIGTYSNEPEMCSDQYPLPLARARRNFHRKVLMRLQMVWVGIWVLRVVRAIVEDRSELFARRWTGGSIE